MPMPMPTSTSAQVHGLPSHVAYSDFDWEDCGFMGKPYHFEQKSRAEAVADWLDDDEAAMADAEARATTLVGTWCDWLQTLSSEPVPALRMDFLVQHVRPGRAAVHSLELTELGFCMLGWKDGPRTVMSALIDTCMETATAADHT